MEESKELQSLYGMFRVTVYVLLLLEFAVFVPFGFTHSGMVGDLLERLRGSWGILSGPVYARMAVFLMMAVTCIGTRARLDLEFDIVRHVAVPMTLGIALTVLSLMCYGGAWEFSVGGLSADMAAYMLLGTVGAVLAHVGLDNISKAVNHGLMRDRNNWEGESFSQETRKIVTRDSVNIPTLFYYKGRMHDGWINIEQPFRGIWVVGVPGSGKTFSIIEPLIRQEAEKGWSMAVYDYKFPTLARKLFYQFNRQRVRGTLPGHSTFNVINFVDVEYSKRVNPIQMRYISSVGDASETAVTLMEALQKGKKAGGGDSSDFFNKAAENLLAACIYFFVNYDVQAYDRDWNVLTRKTRDAALGGGEYFVDSEGREKEVWRWNGRYADLPHVLSFLQMEYATMFDVLMTDNKIASLVAPFKTAYKNKAMDQLEGMAGTLRIYVSRLVTPEAYWVLSGDDFDLKISDPANPAYLVIANDPKMESVITALNAVILNRLVSEVNTGEGKNNPVSIIVDELPTLYFNKIDRLQGTARSNKVSIALGFQSKEQLEKDYGKEVSGALMNIFGNIVCAGSIGKDTVEWISNDVMGKIKQQKRGASVTRDQVTLSLNEEMMPLVPPDKIANMPAGWLCGMTARNFRPLEAKGGGRIDVQKNDEFQPARFYAKTNFDMEEIKREESQYVDIPRFYDFGDPKNRQRILDEHYRKIEREVVKLCEDVLGRPVDED